MNRSSIDIKYEIDLESIPNRLNESKSNYNRFEIDSQSIVEYKSNPNRLLTDLNINKSLTLDDRQQHQF